MMVRWCLLKQNVINCPVFFLLAYIICLFISAIVVGALLSTPLEYVGNSVHTIGSEGCEMASSSQAMIWSCRAINNPHGPPRGFPHITGSPSCWTVRNCRFKSSLWLSKNKPTCCAAFLVTCSSLQDAHLFPNYILDASGFHIWHLHKHLLRCWQSEKYRLKFHCFASAICAIYHSMNALLSPVAL